MPMRVVLIVLAAVISLEAFALTVFPEKVKRIVASLPARELQIVGAVESLVALALVYIIASGWAWQAKWSCTPASGADAW